MYTMNNNDFIEEYTLCIRAHYNANDTAVKLWSFMSSLYTAANTNNVGPLHTFSSHGPYLNIVVCADCAGRTMKQKASALIDI